MYRPATATGCTSGSFVRPPVRRCASDDGSRSRSKNVLGVLTFVAGAVLLATGAPAFAAAGSRCDAPVAVVTSVQGQVEIRSGAGDDWSAAALDQPLCPGAEIRTGRYSRAQVRLLHPHGSDHSGDGTLLQLDARSAMMLPQPERPWWAELLDGAAHVLSRTPKDFTIKTRFANARVEGTEFLVSVEPQQVAVSVFEGRVRVSNADGEVQLSRGETAVAEAKGPPRREIRLQPRDAVHWSLYYPPIIDTRPDRATGLLRPALEHFRRGRIDDAIAALAAIPTDRRDSRFHALRAGMLLSVGQAGEARDDIDTAGRLHPGDAVAAALGGIVALTQNDKAAARRLTEQAVDADPSQPVAHIARSYAAQADFDLETALAAARRATELDAENALAWSRVAELELATGRLADAERDADRARRLDPALARTQTVSGFASLARTRTSAARAAFVRAIALDPADPLPRLGLGLAKIRDGALAEGRREIENAVNLDPGDAIARSYLGKAYYEERRGAVAGTELDRAKQLDPMDPTPWFYDAIRKQTANRPVEALQDLQTAIDLNANRAVYRSRLAVDSDEAARSASLGRIYHDLGFKQLAMVEAQKSVSISPQEYSAHRFLSDSYAELPRHEIARVSELLQSQLRQPLLTAPLQPQLADSRSRIIRDGGPSMLGYNEYNPLFARNGAHLQAGMVVGGLRTFGDELALAAMNNTASFSLGRFHYRTDGFRDNNDLDKDILNAFAQYTPQPATSLQVELRRSEQDGGDLGLRFNPTNFIANLRTGLTADSVRVGARQALGRDTDVIASVIFQRTESLLAVPDPFFPFSVELQTESATGEVQFATRRGRWSLVAGAGHYSAPSETTIVDAFLGDSASDSPGHGTNGYLYLTVLPLDDVAIDLGLSYDDVEDLQVRRHELNPKLGLIWTPTSSTTVRAVALKATKRAFVANQTIEPTSVGGFNQFFDDVNGTVSTRYGLGIDQQLTRALFVGAEASARFLADVRLQDVGDFDWEERAGHAYAYWAPVRWFASSLEYRYERMDRVPEFTGDEDFVDVTTHQLPLTIRLFDDIGLSAMFRATLVDQHGRFGDGLGDSAKGSDSFVVADFGIGYRLPRRLGMLELSARNLFDNRFRFQETDSATPTIARERLVTASWIIAF